MKSKLPIMAALAMAAGVCLLGADKAGDFSAGGSGGLLMPRGEPGFRPVMDGIWVVRTTFPGETEGMLDNIRSRMTSNIFIIDEGSYLTVFDAGWPGEDNLINFAGCLRAMGREPEEIAYLIVSHWHIDHVGLANPIKEMSGCKVAAHIEDVPYMTHDKVVTSEEMDRKIRNAGLVTRTLVKAAMWIMGYSSGGVEGEKTALVQGDPFPVDMAIKEDTRIGRWEVLHTPGHSSGSVALWEPMERILMVGNWAGGLISDNPGQARDNPLTQILPDGDDQAQVRSVLKLQALEPRVILFSHAGELPQE